MSLNVNRNGTWYYHKFSLNTVSLFMHGLFIDYFVCYYSQLPTSSIGTKCPDFKPRLRAKEMELKLSSWTWSMSQKLLEGPQPVSDEYELPANAVIWTNPKNYFFNITDPTKYFGCELGAQTQFDFKDERYIVNGSHEAAKLQDLLDGFIKKFVLCPECDNPETVLTVQAKKEVLNQSCKACGYNGVIKGGHRLINYIIKNPPGTHDRLFHWKTWNKIKLGFRLVILNSLNNSLFKFQIRIQQLRVHLLPSANEKKKARLRMVVTVPERKRKMGTMIGTTTGKWRKVHIAHRYEWYDLHIMYQTWLNYWHYTYYFWNGRGDSNGKANDDDWSVDVSEEAVRRRQQG